MILVMKTTSYYVFALLVVWQALSSWLIGWLVVGSLVAPRSVVVDKSGIERYIKRAEEGADGVKTGQTRCARTVTLLMLGKNGSDSRSLCLPSSFQCVGEWVVVYVSVRNVYKTSSEADVAVVSSIIILGCKEKQ
ncbi:hypothetical protein DINM_000152 [Dirofilaria immitis]|nr:hypothetical protein [Dirofilaria immitis]